MGASDTFKGQNGIDNDHRATASIRREGDGGRRENDAARGDVTTGIKQI
ncbi:MAG: hypothetical protein ABSG87_04340 [Verrucomicrobiota bacterium]|jgi:hypothetical protein